MIIDYADDGRTATLTIKEYGDLLQCRALPEWVNSVSLPLSQGLRAVVDVSDLGLVVIEEAP